MREMNPMSEYYRILCRLADGEWHVLDDLVEHIEGGRPSLLGALGRMQSDGLVLDWRDGRTLCWPNASLPLLARTISDGVSVEVSALMNDIEVHYELESTNHFLHKRGVRHGHVCLAEKQRAGKGRRGRHWHSPLCANIYLSVGWRFDTEPAELSGLSLGVGMKLVEAIRPYAALGLKWPNDLYINHQKLGGILVELQALSKRETGVIIGVGVNVNMEGAGGDIEQAWTSLHHHCESRASIERNGLVIRILEGLLPFLDSFPEQGSNYIMRRWTEFDLAYQQVVTVLAAGKKIEGVGAGIDNQFQFLLQHSHGLSSFSSAEVSLRL